MKSRAELTYVVDDVILELPRFQNFSVTDISLATLRGAVSATKKLLLEHAAMWNLYLWNFH